MVLGFTVLLILKQLLKTLPHPQLNLFIEPNVEYKNSSRLGGASLSSCKKAEAGNNP